MREYRDQLSIDTPEQVDLRLPLAGLGSRCLALLADTVLQVGVYLAVVLVFTLIWSSSDHTAATKAAANTSADTATKWVIAIFIFLNFLFYWGYFTLFEGLWKGQTPGKRLLKLRVLKDSGRQITMFESMTRNFLRIVDALPGVYAVGVIAILSNRSNKRLGDLLAGIVVHQEQTGYVDTFAGASRTFTANLFTPPTPQPHHQAAPERLFPSDTIARLTVEDLVTLDAFFARTAELNVATTDTLALRLLTALCTRMQVEMPTGVSPRTALESIAYELRAQASLRS
jgi:uncharacterized RDD family membrane protein YckC